MLIILVVGMGVIVGGLMLMDVGYRWFIPTALEAQGGLSQLDRIEARLNTIEILMEHGNPGAGKPLTRLSAANKNGCSCEKPQTRAGDS